MLSFLKMLVFFFLILGIAGLRTASLEAAIRNRPTEVVFSVSKADSAKK